MNHRTFERKWRFQLPAVSTLPPVAPPTPSGALRALPDRVRRLRSVAGAGLRVERRLWVRVRAFRILRLARPMCYRLCSDFLVVGCMRGVPLARRGTVSYLCDGHRVFSPP